MDFLKKDYFYSVKYLIQKIKTQVTNWEKNSCKVANTQLIKDLSQNIQRALTQTAPLKIGKDLNEHLAKEDTKIVGKNMLGTWGEGRQKNSPAQLPESCVSLD